MGEASDWGACADCGRPAVSRCDQCEQGLCESHRVVIGGGLGTWSRCRRCQLRNKIKESPLIGWQRSWNQVHWFLNFAWLVVGLAIVLIYLLVRAATAPH